MPEIQDVTRTAFIVAEYRAQENAEQKPLYRDPIVPLFLSKQTHQAADRVAADFLRLLRLLAANGFNSDLPSYVIWEGNTMYLNRPEVLKVLTDLRNKVVNFAISFDYFTEAVINYATGDERISAFTKHFADMGAPWTFGIDDLDALAVDAGLIVADNVKSAELFRNFWPNRKLDAKWYDN